MKSCTEAEKRFHSVRTAAPGATLASMVRNLARALSYSAPQRASRLCAFSSGIDQRGEAVAAGFASPAARATPDARQKKAANVLVRRDGMWVSLACGYCYLAAVGAARHGACDQTNAARDGTLTGRDDYPS